MKAEELKSDCGDAAPGSDAVLPDVRSQRISELYRQHEKALLRMLMARVGSVQEARDIAQEAYVRLLSLDRPGAVSFLEGYLWRIAQNIATDRMRAQRYRDVRDAALAQEPVPAAPSAEQLCVYRQRLELMQQALAELPPKCRKAFILRVFDGLRFDEAARVMGIDVSGVKKYVARALVHCRQAIEAAEGTKRDRS